MIFNVKQKPVANDYIFRDYPNLKAVKVTMLNTDAQTLHTQINYSDFLITRWYPLLGQNVVKKIWLSDFKMWHLCVRKFHYTGGHR